MSPTSLSASRRGILAAAAAGAIGTLPGTPRAATEDSEKGRPVMATRHAADEAAIRQLIDKSVEAIRAMDLGALKACFAPDIVSFDVGPQLESVGVAAKMQNWVLAFTVFQPPIGYEYRDLAITVGDEVAFAHSFNRLSGTMKAGNVHRIGPWVRYTGAYRKVHGAWLIAHDHVSTPINVMTGQALMNLEP
ncbi:MAG: YybH family protein [Caulobacteraceae bacterium]